MPDWSLVNRSHVLAAIAECDRLGSREFLSRYRFARAKSSTLWHGGQEYDSHAIIGLAYLRATGQAVTRAELTGSQVAAVRVLKGLGFDVVVDEEALEGEERQRAARAVDTISPPAAGAPPRSAAPAAKKAAKKATRAKPAEPVVKVCPTCHMSLPATGVCDLCG